MTARVIVIILLVGCGLMASPATDAAEALTYRGHVKADRNSRITLKVNRAESSVDFTAREIKLVCDDGRQPRTDIFSVRADLRRDRSFEFFLYDTGTGAAAGTQTIYTIKGRLIGKRRAEGYLALLVDPFDPPDQPNESECGTFGTVKWKATR
jgi:hypothetical protein